MRGASLTHTGARTHDIKRCNRLAAAQNTPTRAAPGAGAAPSSPGHVALARSQRPRPAPHPPASTCTADSRPAAAVGASASAVRLQLCLHAADSRSAAAAAASASAFIRPLCHHTGSVHHRVKVWAGALVTAARACWAGGARGAGGAGAVLPVKVGQALAATNVGRACGYIMHDATAAAVRQTAASDGPGSSCAPKGGGEVRAAVPCQASIQRCLPGERSCFCSAFPARAAAAAHEFMGSAAAAAGGSSAGGSRWRLLAGWVCLGTPPPDNAIITSPQRLSSFQMRVCGGQQLTGRGGGVRGAGCAATPQVQGWGDGLVVVGLADRATAKEHQGAAPLTCGQDVGL